MRPWANLPRLRDMTECRFSNSTCQIEGEIVPVANWPWLTVTRSSWHYPVGRMIDRFTAAGSNGLLLLHAPGNTFIRDLAAGQRILFQPGGLIWKDPTVSMFLHFEYPHGRHWFSSPRWQAKSTWLALQGPGRIAVQSVFERPEQVGSVRRSSPATQQAW